MERKRIDITSLLKDIPREFGPRKPTRGELTNFISGFGVGESIALAALLLAAWAYLFPRDPERSPRCMKKMTVTKRTCKAKIMHVEVDELTNELRMTCEFGHVTKVRRSRY